MGGSKLVYLVGWSVLSVWLAEPDNYRHQRDQIDQLNHRAQRDGWRSGNMIYIMVA